MSNPPNALIKWLSNPILKLATQAYFAKGLPDLPEQRWPEGKPAEGGLDLSALKAGSLRHSKLGKRQGLILIHHGRLIFEDYYVGDAFTRVYVYSLTKSVGATLIGIAVSRGWLNLEDKVLDWIGTGPSGLHPEATILHVLSQVAESDPPGSAFAYNSGAVINTLSQVLEAVLKKQGLELSVRDFAHQALLRPLGMSNSSWQTLDSRGNLTMGYGMRSTCRDLAKIGQLYLNAGQWQGQEILSPAFIDQATRPAFPEANQVHGFLWWLNPSVDLWIRPLLKGSGQLIEGAPEDMVMGTGMMGNFLYIFPSQNLVMVSTGRTLHHKIESLIIARRVFETMAPALAPVFEAKPAASKI